ncbi:PH domain-containing protein [candidate division KSB1 bacterium]
MEEYYPDIKLKKLWQTILGLWFFVLYVLVTIVLLIVYAVYPVNALLIAILVISLIEIPIAVCVFIWVPYYFMSIKYLVSDDFVRIQQGVIWKNLYTISFEKVQNVEIHQGPIERNYGLGKILLHTAGYSGQSTAEGVIKGIIDFQKLAAVLTEKVKLKTGSEFVSKSEKGDLNYTSLLMNIRDELIDIKKILSEKQE